MYYTMLLAIVVADKLCEELSSCGTNFAELLANPLVELFMVLFSHLLDQLAA